MNEIVKPKKPLYILVSVELLNQLILHGGITGFIEKMRSDHGLTPDMKGCYALASPERINDLNKENKQLRAKLGIAQAAIKKLKDREHEEEGMVQ